MRNAREKVAHNSVEQACILRLNSSDSTEMSCRLTTGRSLSIASGPALSWTCIASTRLNTMDIPTGAINGGKQEIKDTHMQQDRNWHW
jgi:hypothetical protein